MMVKNISGPLPDCSGEDGCSLISILVELGNPNELGGIIGHAGMAIADRFYDIGPGDNLRALPYWSKHTPLLKGIIDPKAGILKNPTVIIQFCACAEWTNAMSQYWDKLLRNLKERSTPWGVMNCATSVVAALQRPGYITPADTLETILTPDELFVYLTPNIRSDCGKSKGVKPYMKLVKERFLQNDPK